MNKFIKLTTMILVFSMVCIVNAKALGSMDYIVDNHSKKVSIPQTHRVVKVIKDTGIEGTKLSEPTDLYVDKNDNIYVADTGNNRIVKFNSSGDYQASFTCNNSLSSPSSVFVSENGDIYVADTLNERVVHMSSNGEYIEKFVKPDSEMINKESTFQISKIGITTQGYLYTIQSQYFMIIDANNDFKGYVGDNHLGFSLSRLLIRTFASKEQQSKLIKEAPPSYYSFDIGNDGLIYATTGESSSVNQIQKINMVGDNIYPSNTYGEKYLNPETNSYVNPRFVDINVDNSGLIYVIEAYTKNIYVYNQAGDMLAVFGGNGNVKGKFNKPVALDSLSNGNLLVLDQATGYIHCFEPTGFMNSISESVLNYNKGNYTGAEQSWKKVLDIDANYPVANKGIADALLKQNKEKEAMSYYKLCDSKGGFGTAFSDYQYIIFRKYFGWVVLTLVAVVGAGFYIIMRMKKKSDKMVKDYYSGGAKK